MESHLCDIQYIEGKTEWEFKPEMLNWVIIQAHTIGSHGFTYNPAMHIAHPFLLVYKQRNKGIKTHQRN